MFGRKKIEWRGAWVLITGAASGIGRQTALDVARLGANLAICDVDEDALTSLATELEGLGADVIHQLVDVSDAGEMERFSERVHAQINAVDVLINNAGVAVEGPMTEMSLDQWSWLMGINVWGVIHGCHFFVPNMKDAQRGGHVINIASLAGLIASSPLGAYSMTKFAVVGMSEALESELKTYGIGVTAICPGFIRTNIAKSMVMTHEKSTRRESLEQLLERRPGPERVSAAIIESIEKGRTLRPVNPEAWLLYLTKRLAPEVTKKSASALFKLSKKLK